jgi:hypothetical protein
MPSDEQARDLSNDDYQVCPLGHVYQALLLTNLPS